MLLPARGLLLRLGLRGRARALCHGCRLSLLLLRSHLILLDCVLVPTGLDAIRQPLPGDRLGAVAVDLEGSRCPVHTRSWSTRRKRSMCVTGDRGASGRRRPRWSASGLGAVVQALRFGQRRERLEASPCAGGRTKSRARIATISSWRRKRTSYINHEPILRSARARVRAAVLKKDGECVTL